MNAFSAGIGADRSVRPPLHRSPVTTSLLFNKV